MNDRLTEKRKINADFTGKWLMQHALLLVVTCCIGGCGDFFAEKPTELQAQEILKELEQVKENKNIKNQLPQFYQQPPARVNIAQGVKLLYFARHHQVENLATLLNQQLGLKVVTSNSTNQLIAYCPDDKGADIAEKYLEMVDVPPVQVNIDCLILERFGDITMDWETSILIENFLGEGVTLGEARGTFQADVADIDEELVGDLLGLAPAFPGAALRETERGTFGLDFGYWIDKNIAGHQVRTIVDVLESKGYLKILLNPTLETINGKEASVTIKDYSSYQEIQTGAAGSEAFNITKYMWVEDTLTVTPYVYADGSIGINTSIKIGSRSKPEGVTQTSIITERSINVEENRIQPGKSLIIGGMRKSEKRSVVRGVPFFKGIPIFGVLFSSKDFEEKATEIIFILTPSISSGGQDYRKIKEDITQKHSDPQYDRGLTDFLTDPFKPDSYSSMLKEEIVRIEADKANVEVEIVQTKKEAETQKLQADKIQAEAEKAKAQAKEAMDAANQIKVQAKTAEKKATDEKIKAEAAIKAAEKAKAEAEKIMVAAEGAKTEATEAKKNKVEGAKEVSGQ